jgi:hypothetical protein
MFRPTAPTMHGMLKLLMVGWRVCRQRLSIVYLVDSSNHHRG